MEHKILDKTIEKKMMNMKNLMRFTCLAMMLALSATGWINAQTPQSIEVVVRDNGIERRDTIDIPVSMTYPIDSLLSDWKIRNFVILSNVDCETSRENPVFSDSVYIDRLSRMPTIMEMAYNDVVRRFIDMYTGRYRKHVSLMLSASNFYIPIFEEALDAYDLPLELKYLPVIESALNPSANSRAGASGLWQFMLGTGKMYGLDSNSLVDERRDPIKSTWAAARYLKELYNLYKDWNLVIAAYNCGPATVNKAIRRSGGKTDYWEIYNYLPRETRGYVPGFIAVNYAMTYYCEHNICPLETNIPADTDTLIINKRLHFQQIADLCGISMEQLRSLNPQYKKNIIPGDVKPHILRLPHAGVCAFIDNRDTIYTHKADALFSNRKTVQIAGALSSGRGTAAPANGTLTYHKIRNGESLSTIAARYKVSVSNIRHWNNMNNNKIVAGKTLKIYK